MFRRGFPASGRSRHPGRGGLFADVRRNHGEICREKKVTAMKKFRIELTGFLEMDTDQECDARVLAERILGEIRSVFSEHGGIQDCGIGIGSVTEKPLARRYR